MTKPESAQLGVREIASPEEFARVPALRERIIHHAAHRQSPLLPLYCRRASQRGRSVSSCGGGRTQQLRRLGEACGGPAGQVEAWLASEVTGRQTPTPSAPLPGDGPSDL